jgi:hypothetical protein
MGCSLGVAMAPAFNTLAAAHLISEIAYRCARDHGGVDPTNATRMCKACIAEVVVLLDRAVAASLTP